MEYDINQCSKKTTRIFSRGFNRITFRMLKLVTWFPRRGPTPLLPNGYSSELRQLGGDLLHREQSQRPSAQDRRFF